MILLFLSNNQNIHLKNIDQYLHIYINKYKSIIDYIEIDQNYNIFDF